MSLPPSPIEIFDRHKIRRQRERHAHALAEHGFLIDWAARDALDRLRDIKRSFPKTLQMGLRTSAGISEQLKEQAGAELFLQTDCTPALCRGPGQYFVAEDDFLPVAPGSLDLIFSVFNLHNVNDLPGALLQIRQALKPDGLFIAALPGGESLHELRSVLTETELSLKGGLSPRLHPLADKQDMGALLQRAGFALPVVDSDLVTVTYDTMFRLLSDLRGMGESNALKDSNDTPPGRAFFFEAAQSYADKFSEEDGRIVASFEIIFLIGWAPHASQQKPLRPGSAQTKLADALGTKEIKAGESL